MAKPKDSRKIKVIICLYRTDILAMALKGIKVIELAGLAPAPFCGMILSDFGAKVTRIDKTNVGYSMDHLARGKRSIAVNLKKKEGVEVVKQLCTTADVLIEPFRRGVMEKLGLGPDVLMKQNPSLIYARLTGFGQSGPYANMAGHDINYLAISGVLSRLGRHGDKPYAPINLLADFAGGGMTCALGIVMALYERTRSQQGQVIDANMVEGAAYVGSWLWRSRDMPIWGQERGKNVLDGGAAFYDSYRTKDDKFMAVGALEPQFFKQLIVGLGLKDVSQTDDYQVLHQKFADIFLTKTREEWVTIFEHTDACVTPVLEFDEVSHHPHNKQRQSFIMSDTGESEPRPAPILSRTPGNVTHIHNPCPGDHTREILLEAGNTTDIIERLLEDGVVEEGKTSSKL